MATAVKDTEDGRGDSGNGGVLLAEVLDNATLVHPAAAVADSEDEEEQDKFCCGKRRGCLVVVVVVVGA